MSRQQELNQAKLVSLAQKPPDQWFAVSGEPSDCLRSCLHTNSGATRAKRRSAVD